MVNGTSRPVEDSDRDRNRRRCQESRDDDTAMGSGSFV
ncbi:MAG: hypothetical protein AVDCRST_MAG25-2445 [uncultured Rubrobacteraceae bacterium]|uniref:Uncharacterized protein n=1 Tax=uncultured Rubrobacteraceae bacterium TaxID=349277 RepID=A0A6J4RPW8_9ACTN|nr:MAG: hypothetical protein AVDCRST_MAG25-2445 [uncultured Rubrobacteraceae bacterium]